jgi:DNA-binding transcriptional MocR family regulator
MLAVNLVLSGNIKRPMYLRLADYYKEEIRTGRLPGGARLPSIRKLAAALGASRTTVETAYALLLAEGFIISEPKRGYKAVGNGTLSASAPESPEDKCPARLCYTILPATTSMFVS